MAQGNRIQNLLAKLKRLASKIKKVREPVLEEMSSSESDAESFGCPLERVPTPYYIEIKPALKMKSVLKMEPILEMESETETYGLRRVPTPYPSFMTTGRANYTK
ncbi:hypothetical protein BDV32DRAFT_151017 [Aspergillus pseudonomiae]|uniref:Uncharacterized protein n=1 Tax=Aspergillus pseudonomiae TaxID=1506151 RepID=A0A5N7DAC3_9EURO|nr:uncharacterized protein BDV37DRAFT_283835 [Aspergillus pseudonomiae]KAB8258752.1 hypothetical protein BDV32DRAFT_151017 [Aspergillus pseudonomiae]KAE8403416.1 hypothetical protein BDV37DRAFT_283835 [Aspergillus pseudonomiae]